MKCPHNGGLIRLIAGLIYVVVDTITFTLSKSTQRIIGRLRGVTIHLVNHPVVVFFIAKKETS